MQVSHRRRAAYGAPIGDAFQWSIDAPPAGVIATGRGSAVPIIGWCYHRDLRIRRLRIRAGDRPGLVLAHGLPRPDVREAHFPDADPRGHSYASGFFAAIRLPEVEHEQPLELALEVTFTNGHTESYVFDRIELRPGLGIDPHPALSGAEIVICMTARNPDYELFARQVESISQQTVTGWRCLISDDRSAPHAFDRISALLSGDDRFVLDRNQRWLGSYYNFERALARVGPETDFVGLADHDDRWHPDKLDALLDALGPKALLAYSDCRVVAADGRLLVDTFFPRRRNNWTDLRSLVLANTVTGAAVLMRRSVLDLALPFPPYMSGAYHDHWLACVALSAGELAYVDRPLWDYVQHGDNLLGHASGQQLRDERRRGEWVQHHLGVYKELMIRIVTTALALEERLDGRMAPAKRRELELISSIEHSPAGLARLLVRAARERPDTSSTLGVERQLLSGVAWRRRMALAGRRRNRVMDSRFTSALMPPAPVTIEPAELDGLGTAETRSIPLTLTVRDSEPRRLNILVATGTDPLEPAHVALVQLGSRMHACGTRVRLVEVDATARLPDGWRDDGEVRSGVELVDLCDRLRPLAVSPGDTFAAGAWWTARLAHAAASELGSPRFLYLIRDYEPDTAASRSWAAEAEASYALPHWALFSTEPVRAWFRRRAIGVYGPGGGGDESALVFEEALTRPAPPTAEALRGRTLRRLLVYAPLESETSTMPELAVLALDRAAREGLLDGWELTGIGVHRETRVVDLPGEAQLSILRGRDMPSWPELLAGHDVALALSATPRTTLASLQLAAAGIVTVTNTVGDRDRHWLASRSANLIGADSSADGIVAGLRIALERAGDVDGRIEGSRLVWPKRWVETFPAAKMRRVARWFAP